MILSFGDKETQKIWAGNYSKKFPSSIQPIARRKLRMIDSAHIIDDLRIPPGNRLEKLRGAWDGFWSIRVNKQWRIVFQWLDDNALLVRLTDYH